MSQKTEEKSITHNGGAVADCPYQAQKAFVREIKTIDQDIHQVEVEASRQTDEVEVARLLDERERLLKRKTALPFLLRGARVRFLRMREGEHRAKQEALEVRHDAATAELEAARRHFEETAEALRLATERVKAAEQAEHAIAHEMGGEGARVADYSIDAHRVEQGIEPLRDWFAEPE